MLNVLSNALKFTPSDGRICVSASEKAGDTKDTAIYEFSVEDTGIGMSPEFLEHIFEPFERERTSTVSGIQGTGLGMSITENQEIAVTILEDAGYTVDVASNGAEAVEKVRNSANAPYDLILMDIQMPVMDGHLGKPIDVDELFSTLQSILGNPQV